MIANTKRLLIGIFGRRNVGKSSILNAITRQQTSIVSHHAGTTTDPVEKPMELLPLGPVLFIDTAGIDDDSALGELRIQKTKQVFNRVDIAIIIASENKWTKFEDILIKEFKERKVPIIVVFNKCDIIKPDEKIIDDLIKQNSLIVQTVATEEEGILDLKTALLDSVPEEFIQQVDLLGDIVNENEYAVLVVPIDKEAPKDRLIRPQIRTLRNLLDINSFAVVAKETELKHVLSVLKVPPKLVVTDSQAFKKVSHEVPDEVLMTSFSILYARLLGDLGEMVQGSLAIDKLKNGDKVLIAESCSHHPIGDDIGRVKIPAWLNEYIGGKLNFATVQGHDFPEDLASYKLVVHCGACMMNRKEVLSRIIQCRKANVPITNYGLTIAYSLGIFERALRPFPSIYESYKTKI